MPPTDKNVLRGQFEQYLNEIVEDDNWIDAIFVVDLQNGFMMYGSSTKKGTYPDLVETLKVGGKGANITKILSGGTKKELDNFGQKCGRGTLNSMIFKFSNGILNAYIYAPRNISFAVGFVNASNEGLGSMLSYCEDYIIEIIGFLDKLHG